MENLSSACTHFSFDLFRKINENNATGNVFFSPISISTALAMVLLGARGNTAQQISRILHFDAVKDLHSNFQTLNAEINKKNVSSYALNLANRLFGEKSFKFLPDFLSSVKKQYNADLGTVDFISAAEDARKEINTWVSEQTKGKIPEVLSAGAVNSFTKLVLVNAIYFKGDWAKKFKAEHTKDMPFQLNKKEQKTVKMMYQMEKLPFNYIPEINCRVLELPYVDYELSMVIVLPDNINDDTTGLQQLEKELSLEKINEWTENMMPIDVHVHLPKFKLEDSYKLKSQLAGMGMADLFEAGSADLSGMSGSNDLYLSEVIHKSFVEVNEEGTEAAAASAGIAMMCLMREEEFNANHPFLFFIRHNATKSILFFGRYSSP
ncbi:leukocyte elastase inhibitor [Xenopus tropicalis]|uniref:Leukocyte elastase inhibitor n=1 Tax=Xenopus tropicalis TaxID=8364 RepID=ILEU_XENTR|nr:leukocyte elastase inhibitor [Xenopus tropicalis]Q5I0S8.1 RecName: Full=Leukocyte elastase inhibitor; AltName: Full=Serpin B1 [Xenopus tropicalis]AAH88021.1 serpin peptidase inhibitor, clade B (ovalbumin), member 1 [Xenopus tropicalis]|eukprot:XP_012820078.1 PREDICTED: leukocyte elastase inhibitor isoform X1 [Xenopus tropicalis]